MKSKVCRNIQWLIFSVTFMINFRARILKEGKMIKELSGY